MADVLNSVIDLNASIVENDLEKAKEAVANINKNLEELRERFDINEDDIGTYFGIYDTMTKFLNETTEYILDNLNGLKGEYKNRTKWLISGLKVIEHRDSDEMSQFVKDSVAAGALVDYQYAMLIRIVNICQNYGLLALLKKGDA